MKDDERIRRASASVAMTASPWTVGRARSKSTTHAFRQDPFGDPWEGARGQHARGLRPLTFDGRRGRLLVCPPDLPRDWRPMQSRPSAAPSRAHASGEYQCAARHRLPKEPNACDVLNLLGTLLPGVRDLRAPLAAGAILLLAGWIAFEPATLPPADKASGLYKAVLDLNDFLSIGVTAVAAFVASIIGGVLSTLTAMVVNWFLRSAWSQDLGCCINEQCRYLTPAEKDRLNESAWLTQRITALTQPLRPSIPLRTFLAVENGGSFASGKASGGSLVFVSSSDIPKCSAKLIAWSQRRSFDLPSGFRSSSWASLRVNGPAQIRPSGLSVESCWVSS